MDKTYLGAALTRAGLLPSALPDAERRADVHFLSGDPTPQELDAWCQALAQEAAHLFGQRPTPDEDEAPMPWEAYGVEKAVWDGWSPEHRMGVWREAEAEAGVRPDHGREQRRPPPVTLTAAEIARLADLTPTQRLTQYRALQEAARR